MEHNLISIKLYLKKYKKKIIFIGIGIGVGYYLYKKFLSEKVQILREMYSKLHDYDEMFKMNSNFDNLAKHYESCFGNLLSNLLNEIKIKLEKEFSLSMLFNRISTASKEEFTKLWIVFKNKTLISFYCSIFITRVLLLLSQTHSLILEKLKISNDKLPQSFYEELLTDLWILAVNYIEYLVKHIENKLTPLCDQIILNNNFVKEKFIEEFRKFRDRVEEISVNKHKIHLFVFEKYFKDVENKIITLEKTVYVNDIQSMKVNSFLKFYNIYYDIISSNLFQTVLVKALDYDFCIMEDLIEGNFENEKKNNMSNTQLSVPKIVSFIQRMRTQLLDHENTTFQLKSYKNHNFPDELNEYFKIIYD